ncbi:MAG: peptidoglycan bridge formation glycyltransferase FemA/FemB family protein [Ignavibacteriae bacterium]|nr:peptidoglycan bridge formation glycyltransferase FemA/FemB family protein [Ignavibacteriota bacterium]
MSYHIHIVDPCTSEEWREFVATHPQAGIFHHPAWITLLRETYGYPMFAVCAMRNGKIRGGIPFADVHSPLTGYRWISLPFSDACPPLLVDDDQQTAAVLFNFLRSQLSIATPRIEIHSNVHAQSSLYHEKKFFQHVLDLRNSPETLFRSFDRRTTQRSINIAEKNAVVVRECVSKEEFDAFYDLQVMTRKRLGVPVQPRTLFNGIWDRLIKPGLGFALVSWKDTTPIAGGVFLAFNNTLVCKYSASDVAYKALQPSHAFIWAGIQKGIERGYASLDFGRSENCNLGLRRFKKNWGAVEHELNYSVLATSKPSHHASPLTGILGRIIRHSPAFVCKFTGALLYKHFA